MSQMVFQLSACCIPVRGARRSTLCDVQRQAYCFIPNGLYEILTAHRGKFVDEIKTIFDHGFDDEIDGYFEFLIQNEFGFWCDEPESFPTLDLRWETPELITNAIIDVGATSCHDFGSLFAQLDDLGCKALQLRFFRSVAMAELDEVLEKTASGRLRSIDLLAPYRDGWTLDRLQELSARHQRLANAQVHSAPSTETRQVGDGLQIGLQIGLFSQRVGSSDHCGEVHPGYFVTNLSVFTEAQRFNTCLNRKLSIDECGEIRNCPSLPTSFGNARETSLHSALAKQGFRDLWEINKDQIETCKDCEFRYICTDCRAFITDPADRLSKPSKCTYDPYSASWKSA
jgi:SPASM domain peptide maturase of grasp-with-spasm system